MSKAHVLIIAVAVVILGVVGGAFWFSANKKPSVNIEIERSGGTRQDAGSRLPSGETESSGGRSSTSGGTSGTQTQLSRQQLIDLIKKNTQAASEFSGMSNSASQVNENSEL